MPARTVTLELSEEQARWVDERVAEGAYPDAAAAISDAVEAQRNDGEPAMADEELRAAVQEPLKRLEQGRSHLLTMEQVFGRMTEEHFAGRSKR